LPASKSNRRLWRLKPYDDWPTSKSASRRLALIVRVIALIAWLVGVVLVLLSVLSPATFVTAAAGTPLFLGFSRPAGK